jgi:hypothetical protein
MQIIKLHRHGNSTYYAIVYSGDLAEETLLILRAIFKSLDTILQLQNHLLSVKILGVFKDFDNDFCNGKVNETCSHPLNEGDDFDENIRPWQKFDYVNKKYVDWYGPLMTKGGSDPEFKFAYDFSYRASFKSSLVASGIPERDVDKTFVFEIVDYRGEQESDQFDFAQWIQEQPAMHEPLQQLFA